MDVENLPLWLRICLEDNMEELKQTIPVFSTGCDLDILQMSVYGDMDSKTR